MSSRITPATGFPPASLTRLAGPAIMRRGDQLLTSLLWLPTVELVSYPFALLLPANELPSSQLVVF